jgi:hypothetical protein
MVGHDGDREVLAMSMAGRCFMRRNGGPGRVSAIVGISFLRLEMSMFMSPGKSRPDMRQIC